MTNLLLLQTRNSIMNSVEVYSQIKTPKLITYVSAGNINEILIKKLSYKFRALVRYHLHYENFVELPNIIINNFNE